MELPRKHTITCTDINMAEAVRVKSKTRKKTKAKEKKTVTEEFDNEFHTSHIAERGTEQLRPAGATRLATTDANKTDISSAKPSGESYAATDTSSGNTHGEVSAGRESTSPSACLKASEEDNSRTDDRRVDREVHVDAVGHVMDPLPGQPSPSVIEAVESSSVSTKQVQDEALSDDTNQPADLSGEEPKIQSSDVITQEGEPVVDKNRSKIQEGLMMLQLKDFEGATASLKPGSEAAQTEDSEVRPARPKVAHRKLYPPVEGIAAPPMVGETLRPFTDEQLKTLYYNSELEALREYTDEFIKHINNDKHEFYELMLNYYRARNHLVNAEHDINSLRDEAEQHLDRVWITRERTMLVQGRCADQAKVSVQHKFDQVTFSEEACSDLSRTLKDIRTHIHDQMSLHAYASQLSRLQVESYIYDFYMRSPGLSDLSKNLPVRTWLPREREASLTLQVTALCECISVLFMFQRKPAKDNMFVNDTRHWINRLVATLLRVATLEDHLWLLQHVLRCPAGVGSWAADLIQVAPPPATNGRTSWGSPLLDHCLTMLAVLMSPIRGRQEALYQLKAAVTPSQETADHPWIMVDSDGEEDEDNLEGWHYLHENDLVKILQQFPLNEVFKHTLFIESDQAGGMRYDICQTSETSLLKLFAFVSCVVSVLSQGLHNFNLSRYRQFNKRIGNLIKQVIGLVSDHWQNYKVTLSALSPSTEDRLQLEYDQVFYRATRAILSAQRLGSWQFMADMPYSNISMTMMWKLVWMMHHGYKDKLVDIDQSMTVEQCVLDLDDEVLRKQFEERLLTLPTSEAIYLLTAFANMAGACHPAETMFVEAITSEIYQMAYLSTHTREFCSKVGRELLASIARHHPFIISVILDHIKVTLDRIGVDTPQLKDFAEVSLYLFRELPLGLWRPLERDYQLLRGWLLEEQLGSIVHQLACHIYANINWGVDPQGADLFLPLAVHRQTAILLVEVATRHLTSKHMASFITDSVRQVASVVRSSVTPEQALCSWLWDVALKLLLHANQQPHPVPASPTSGVIQGFDAPNLSDDPKLHPMLKAVQEKSALASYLALIMTKYGHSITDVCGEGVTLLTSLVDQCHFTPAIRALSLVIPLFYQCPQYLTSSVRFIHTLQALVTADSQKRGLLSADFPGHVTQLFTTMTQSQVVQQCLPPGTGGAPVVLFWLQLLTQITRWHQDRNVLHVINQLIAAAYRTQQGRDVISQFFININKHLLVGQREQGVMSTLVSWMAAGYTQPSFIEGQSCAEFPWFALSVLLAERHLETTSGLWSRVQGELFSNPTIPLEAALKRAATHAKLETTAAPQRLCIYRWAHQALETPLGHPVLPLLWQQFFLCYLGRLTQEHELPQRGSIGERFFESSGNNSLMKQMKKRLNEAAEYHHRAAMATSTADSVDVAGVLSPTSDTADDSLVLVEGRQDNEGRAFHESLVRLYQTMTFWLDEPRLHDPHLYLPALPPQYDAEKLLKLFNSDQKLWFEFFRVSDVEEKLGALASEWMTSYTQRVDPSLLSSSENETPTSRILTRMQTINRPQDPPPQMVARAPVPEVHPSILCDKQAMLYALRSDLHSISDYARLFTQRVAKNVALDCNFIDLLPSLYRNEPTEIILSAACTSTFNPTHRCKGPGSLTVQYEAKKRAELVSRKVEENRVEYKQLMIESLLPPAQNICSAVVHVENTISALIRQSQAATTQDSSKRAQTLEVGSNLFYYLATLISEETKYYPPTRQFFAACIEVLGQEFIRNHPGQSQPLMQAILQTPSLAELLSPNFSPNASPHLFITMYEDVIPVPTNQGPAVAFTLLTKFDVEAWLTRSKPSLSQRAALVQVIGSALCSCGQDPDRTMAVAFEVYRSHLMQVFTHRFPDHYGDVLRLIVNGSKAGDLSPKMWGDFLKTLGCAVVLETSPPIEDIEIIEFTPPKTVTPTSPPPQPQIILSAKDMRETLEWLSSHYFTARVSTTDAASFGLYPRWKPYIPYIATFLGHLATQTVLQTATVCRNGDMDPQQAVLDLWKQIIDAFAPWIQPLDNNGQVLSPWLDSDIVMASTMVGTFVDVLKTLYESFEDLVTVPRDALCLLWMYYVDTLSLPGTPDHVLQVIHSQFRALPWTSFHPDAQAMALMLRLKERHSRSCFLFAGHVMTSVKWAEILERVGNHEALSRSHATLFQLLIYMACETDLIANTGLADLLREAEHYNWSFLDSVSYTTAVNWFLDNCDPRCVVAERSSKAAVVLRLLRSAAGFVHESNVSFHLETPLKRVSCVRCYIKLMCRCSHLADIPPDHFAVLTTNLLTDVEAVIGTTTNPTNQHQEALTLCSEVLAALNNLNPASGGASHVLTALLQWLESSCSSILLLPVISAAGRTLASLAHMVQLVEASVDAHFVSGVGMEDACGWGWVLAAVQVPDLTQEEFVSECIVQGSYLTLFAHVLQQLPLCQSPQNELTLLKALVTWTAKARPTPKNEAKLLLWWGKVLELALRQIHFHTEHQAVLETLLAFTPALATLGEDKSSSGLWGAIGLGKKSPLSHRFRLLVRCLLVFLLAQMPNKASLRVAPHTAGAVRGGVDESTPPPSPSRRGSASSSSSSTSPRSPAPSPQATAALSQLEALRTNKHYAAFAEHIDWAVRYTGNPAHCLHDAPNVLVHLATHLFQERPYLGLLRPQLG